MELSRFPCFESLGISTHNLYCMELPLRISTPSCHCSKLRPGRRRALPSFGRLKALRGSEALSWGSGATSRSRGHGRGGTKGRGSELPIAAMKLPKAWEGRHGATRPGLGLGMQGASIRRCLPSAADVFRDSISATKNC